MKNLVISFILGLAIFQQVSAQDKFYNFTFTLGVSPKQTPLQADLFCNREDPLNEMNFNLKEISRYYQAGLTKNFRFNQSFFGTLGLHYSLQEQQYDYTYTYKEPIAGIPQNLSITSQVMTLPVGIGARIKNFDVTSGLQLQYAFKSEMKDDFPSGIEMSSSKANLGWFAGTGYSLGRTRIGVQYQSSMNRYGENLSTNGQSMGLRSVPGNFMFTIGFSF